MPSEYLYRLKSDKFLFDAIDKFEPFQHTNIFDIIDNLFQDTITVYDIELLLKQPNININRIRTYYTYSTEDGNIDSWTKKDETPLLCALNKDPPHIELIKFLLDKGANPEIPCEIEDGGYMNNNIIKTINCMDLVLDKIKQFDSNGKDLYLLLHSKFPNLKPINEYDILEKINKEGLDIVFNDLSKINWEEEAEKWIKYTIARDEYLRSDTHKQHPHLGYENNYGSIKNPFIAYFNKVVKLDPTKKYINSPSEYDYEIKVCAILAEKERQAQIISTKKEDNKQETTYCNSWGYYILGLSIVIALSISFYV